MTEQNREEILKDIREGYIDEWDNMTIDELFETIEKEHKEIQQYRAIGTVQHCREAVEKSQEMKLKPPKTSTFTYKGICPVCRNKILISENYCSQCGQKVGR